MSLDTKITISVFSATDWAYVDLWESVLALVENSLHIRLARYGKGSPMRLKAVCSDPSLKIEYQAWPASRPDWWTPRTWDTPNKGYSVAGYVVTIPAGHKVTLTTTLVKN